MKKILFLFLAIVLVAVAAVTFTPTRAWLVALTLPDYPDWPSPVTELSADDRGTIHFASSSPYDLEVILTASDRATPTTGLGYLSYPDSASTERRVPAMVILPGSGGIAPGREHEHARWLNQHGIAAFVIDYYEPRGFGPDSNYMVRTSAVTEFDLIADAYAALRLLSTSPLIDPQRIGVMGFSYGGMAARLAMDQRIHKALAPDSPAFSLHIDVYGPCFQDLQSPVLTGAPLLTLRGTEDASNDLPACTRREQQVREHGVAVTAKVYPGVGHAWEVERPRAMSEESPYLSGCEVTYDDRGRPYLAGSPLNSYDVDASLATRVAARFSSGLRFKDCVGYGYIVGRDEAAREQAYEDTLAFIARHWSTLSAIGTTPAAP